MINPFTGRKIKVGGPTHRKIMKYHGGIDSQDIVNLGTDITSGITSKLEKIPEIGKILGVANKLGFALANAISKKTSKLKKSLKAQNEGIDIFGYKDYLPFDQFPKIQQDVFLLGRSFGQNIAREFPKGKDNLREHIPDGEEEPEDNPGLSPSELNLPYPSNNVFYGYIVYNKDGSINWNKSNPNNYNQLDIQFAHNKIASKKGY